MNDPNLSGRFLEYYNLTQPIYQHAWPPSIKCPACVTGVCTLSAPEIEFHESAKSLSLKNITGDEPTLMNGNFSAKFKCVNQMCQESLVAVGTWTVEETDLEAYARPNLGPYERVMTIEYLNPPLNLAREFPSHTPRKVLARVGEASKLLWADPNAAGTRIRLTIEEMLIANGALKGRSTLQRRIEHFSEAQPQAGQALMAIKWIGNDATHDANLTHLNIFNALDILRHAINLIFPADFDRMNEMISVVNTRGRGETVT